MTVPRVLIIAGSDSSGGAGIEADSRVLATHGVYTMTATTALTVQNTLGVQDVVVTPPDVVRKMIEANLDDVGCDGVKIGMLASAKIVEVVAETLPKYNVKSIVLDPVMVSTSGSQLLPGDAVRNLREKLIPACTVLTPNIPEATLLLRDADIGYKNPTNLSELKDLAKLVHRLGAKSVLLKGGHIPLTKGYQKATADSEMHWTIDILYDGNDFTTVESPYQTSKNTHGTGCSLASAIAANLARHPSQPLSHSVRSAIRYVGTGIATSHTLNFGHGPGPINHFHHQLTLPFSPGHFIEYLLSRPDVSPLWHRYTHHPFPAAMATNTLPLPHFKSYLIQDYLYLVHFARANALAAYKSTDMTAVAASAQIVLHIHTEMALHLSYCREFGLSRQDIEATPESLVTTAYSRYVLDVGASQDWLALQMSLLPCLVGYGVAAARLHEDPDRSAVTRDNPYWRWVENYVADDYREAVRKGRELIETHIPDVSPRRIEELVAVFVRATEMEIAFWEFGAHDVPANADTDTDTTTTTTTTTT